MNPPFPRRRPAAEAGWPRRIRWGRWTRWIHWIHRGRGLRGATRPAALSAPAAPSGPAAPLVPSAPADVELDEALLTAVGERIATVAPERGGALLAGPDGVARLLLEDDCGTYSPASWDISPQLTGAVGELEEGGELVLCGTVHSHPAGMPDPSSTDVRTMTHTLELNPHLDRMIVLVLTKGAPRDGDLAVGTAHRLSVHVLDRRESGFEMRRARAVVRARPAGADDGADADPAAGTSPVPGAGRVGAVRVGEFLRARESRLLAEATAAARAQMRDEEQDSDEPSGEGDDALARVRGLVGSIEERAVLVAGAGSVGSRIAEDLVRSGVGRIVVIDPDAVSLPNMARSVYTRAQIGVPKVRALAERLHAINPRVEVVPMEGTLDEHGQEALETRIDLVVLATDAMLEQGRLAASAYCRGIPQVACALFRRAAAGEVVMVVPQARTPCWSCCVGGNAAANAARPAPNYGLDGRLVSESGLGASINLVASAASLAAIGILAGPGSVAGRALVSRVGEGRGYGFVTTTPGWPILEQIVPSQRFEAAPRSVWPLVHRTGDCPVCGETVQETLTAPVGKVQDLDDLFAPEGPGEQQADRTDDANGGPTEGTGHPECSEAGRFALVQAVEGGR